MVTVFNNASGNVTGLYVLGNGMPHKRGAWGVQISGGGTYSITVRSKVTGSAVANSAAPLTAYTTCAAPTSPVTTALTAANNILIEAPGDDVILDVAYTSGALLIEAEPLDL